MCRVEGVAWAASAFLVTSDSLLQTLFFRVASELSTFAFTSVLKLSLAWSSFRPAQSVLSAGTRAVLNCDLSEIYLPHAV